MALRDPHPAFARLAELAQALDEVRERLPHMAPEHQIGARELIADLERRFAKLAAVVAQLPPAGEDRPE